jgi:hypothetical protein
MCVQHAQGVELDVKPAKVVAGLEPEFTNLFLQEYAKAAGNPGAGCGALFASFLPSIPSF